MSAYSVPSFCICRQSDGPLITLNCSVGMLTYTQVTTIALISPCAANLIFVASDNLPYTPPVWFSSWGPLTLTNAGMAFQIGSTSAIPQQEWSGVIDGSTIGISLSIGACTAGALSSCDWLSWLPVVVLSGNLDFSGC
jgi:hypothetical protein